MHNTKHSVVYEMPADKYNDKLSKILKEMPEFEQPLWTMYVKTGPAKTKPPQEPDFWHKRSASVLRQIYIHKVVGVNRLKTRYGSKKNRGMKPERFYKASGKMLRTILQQAERAGILEKYLEPGKKAGRRMTKHGTELLEGVK
jgi:small subunit ribosomal protein S19e